MSILATPFVRSDIFVFERVQCVDVDVGVFALRSHSVDCTTGNKALLAKLPVGGRLVTRATITHRVKRFDPVLTLEAQRAAQGDDKLKFFAMLSQAGEGATKAMVNEDESNDGTDTCVVTVDQPREVAIATGAAALQRALLRAEQRADTADTARAAAEARTVELQERVDKLEKRVADLEV
eukprot:COSAG06_NODE_2030_length_7782_cov_5.203429_1_plen_180_part_00